MSREEPEPLLSRRAFLEHSWDVALLLSVPVVMAAVGGYIVYEGAKLDKQELEERLKELDDLHEAIPWDRFNEEEKEQIEAEFEKVRKNLREWPEQELPPKT